MNAPKRKRRRLNERRLESPSQVRSGDKVRIGTTVLELRA